MRVFLVALLVYGLALLGLALGRLCGRAGPRPCAHDCDTCPRPKQETEPCATSRAPAK